MALTLPFAEATSVGSPALNIAIFASFVVITLVIVIRVSAGKKTAEQYYTAAGAFTGRQNGVAIAGDYLSAASFLGIAGAIALQGYDGFLYSIGFLVAWLVALLLVAELMRNTGRFTMADVLSYRLRQRPVRIATAISVLTVSFFYLLAQMAGAGGLVSLLLGITGETAQNLVIVLVGVIMITYVLIGGMKGTTWVQIIKALLLIAGTAVITLMVLGKFSFSISDAVPVGGRQLPRRRQAVRARPEVRQEPHDQDRLHLAVDGARARHRRPPARAPAVLHRPDQQAGPQVGGVGDLADRRLLPADPGRRLRRRRTGRPQGHPRRPRQGQLGRAAARLRARRVGAARRHLGDRVRDDPRRRRRPDHHDVGDLRARPLQGGLQAWRHHPGPGGQGRAHGIRRHRRHRDPRRHPRQGPEHRLPRGAGLRGRRERQPADHPVLAVLEGLQHPWRPLVHLRRSRPAPSC